MPRVTGSESVLIEIEELCDTAASPSSCSSEVVEFKTL
jgi:hypothetical protein